MTSHQHIPLDPGEIDHVLMLLRSELDPKYIQACKAAGVGRLDLHRRVRADVEGIVLERLKDSRECPRDNSDWAYLASDDSVSGFDRACARARCSLWWLEECAISQSDRALDPDDPPVPAWDQDWERLRLALVEVAHWLTFAELLDKSKRAKQAAAHARAISADVANLKKFRDGRRKGTLERHTEYLRDIMLDNPGMRTKDVIRKVEAALGQDDCPFESDGGNTVTKSKGTKLSDDMVDDARRKYVNPKSGE